jgi:putative nucleotidyltransferase with HDIG domain
MNKKEAKDLLHENMQNENLRRHCYAVGETMKALAKHFGEDENKWEVVGLLHDGDYEKTKDTPEKHTLMMTEWLKEAGVDDKEILDAILSHNYAHTGENPPKNKLEWSLYCCDDLTGLIVAVTLVKPDKKLASVTNDSVMNKWNQKSFAAGVHREQIEECEDRLEIPLKDFIGLTLSAMQEISSELCL